MTKQASSSDRELLNRVFEAMVEASSQSERTLRESLANEGLDPDDLVKRGLDLVHSLLGSGSREAVDSLPSESQAQSRLATPSDASGLPSLVDWVSKLEAELLRLDDVDDASVVADGDLIREVHVLTSSRRQPQQIVRDVQTLIAALRRLSGAFTTDQRNEPKERSGAPDGTGRHHIREISDRAVQVSVSTVIDGKVEDLEHDS